MIFFLPEIIHWVYSFKLWNLQRQLSTIVNKTAAATNDEEEPSQPTLWLIFFAGVAMILVSSSVFAVDLWKHKFTELWRVLLFLCSILTSLMSLLFTVFSFKWMRELPDQSICIPWSNVLLHTSAFFVYALALVLFFSLTLRESFSLTLKDALEYDFDTFFLKTRRTTIVYEFYLVFNFVSLFILLYIFNLLLKKQG